MKTNITITLVSLLLFLISCAKEDSLLEQGTDNHETLPPSESNEDIPVFNSWEDIENYWKAQTGNSFNSDNNQLANSDVTEYSYTGYTKYSTGNEQKGMFSAEFAEKLGLKVNTIYTYKFMNVIYKVDLIELGATVNNKLIVVGMDSPNCGYAETFNLTRGYSLANSTLATLILHFLTDNSGTPINSYKPCHPDEIEWNYKVAKYRD